MNTKRSIAALLVAVAVVGMAALVGTLAAADSAGTGDQPQMQLPPGWTADDMQACMVAGMPGEMHQQLAEGAGTWHGKTQMWMAPGTEPLSSECTSTVSPIMDGRFMKCKLAGVCPIMGEYNGLGLSGFDNVSQKFVSTWIDNHSSGVMVGEGELSSDGKVMNWEFTTNCPITKKPTVVRQIETTTGPNTKTLEMFGSDPKSGKDFKMMHIEFVKQ
jgi:hypothetical protein